jgi:hypothetical protein
LISRRFLEVAAALLTAAFGIAVALSSLDNGIGWSEAGVESGTFPFLTGLVVLGGSLVNLVQGWRRGEGIVLRAAEARRIAGLLVPALVFVALIPLLGLVGSAALYLFAALRLGRRLSTVPALAVSLAAAVALWAVFERAFQIGLPHGWLVERLLA